MTSKSLDLLSTLHGYLVLSTAHWISDFAALVAREEEEGAAVSTRPYLSAWLALYQRIMHLIHGMQPRGGKQDELFLQRGAFFLLGPFIHPPYYLLIAPPPFPLRLRDTCAMIPLIHRSRPSATGRCPLCFRLVHFSATMLGGDNVYDGAEWFNMIRHANAGEVAPVGRSGGREARSCTGECGSRVPLLPPPTLPTHLNTYLHTQVRYHGSSQSRFSRTTEFIMCVSRMRTKDKGAILRTQSSHNKREEGWLVDLSPPCSSALARFRVCKRAQVRKVRYESFSPASHRVLPPTRKWFAFLLTIVPRPFCLGCGHDSAVMMDAVAPNRESGFPSHCHQRTGRGRAIPHTPYLSLLSCV